MADVARAAFTRPPRGARAANLSSRYHVAGGERSRRKCETGGRGEVSTPRQPARTASSSHVGGVPRRDERSPTRRLTARRRPSLANSRACHPLQARVATHRRTARPLEVTDVVSADRCFSRGPPPHGRRAPGVPSTTFCESERRRCASRAARRAGVESRNVRGPRIRQTFPTARDTRVTASSPRRARRVEVMPIGT